MRGEANDIAVPMAFTLLKSDLQIERAENAILREQCALLTDCLQAAIDSNNNPPRLWLKAVAFSQLLTETTEKGTK